MLLLLLLSLVAAMQISTFALFSAFQGNANLLLTHGESANNAKVPNRPVTERGLTRHYFVRGASDE